MEDRYYFIKRMKEKILWTYKPKFSTKVLHVFSTIFWVPIPILLIGVILSLFKLTDWKIMVLFQEYEEYGHDKAEKCRKMVPLE